MTTPTRSVLVGIVLSIATGASAQVLNGEIFGRVTDQTDAVLPGVTITISGQALIQPMVVVGAESGAFRFARVPIGVYRVTFELPGFSTVVREGIIVQAGRNVELNIKLNLSTVQETVTITGASPVVDTKSTALGVNFGRELLEAIPTARDPWVIIEQTPGLVMSANNVGGRNSGQMEGYNAYGSGANKQWSMDGATVTDMASNSAPTYYDFEMFEEIQITTGGMDASQETGGVSVNMVTKSGSNQLRGSGRVFVVDKALQSKNAPPEVVVQGGGAGNPLKNNTEYGVEVGGPIKRDRA
ncbi:MAG: carboxypeptidase regulatory-like domain-containing protein [Acidobacteriota bacterium]